MQKWKCYYCSVIYLITVFTDLTKILSRKELNGGYATVTGHCPVETIHLF